MDVTFLAALRDRGIPDANLENMSRDKVDQDVVKLMDEETLSKYLPHFGDRLFAKNWTGSTLAEAESNAEKKKTLVERIRAKMKLPSSGQATTSSSNHTHPALGLGNKNAARKTRKLELGWMNYQDGYFRQVRRPTGGGTREIIARKVDTVNKILGDGKKTPSRLHLQTCLSSPEGLWPTPALVYWNLHATIALIQNSGQSSCLCCKAESG